MATRILVLFMGVSLVRLNNFKEFYMWLRRTHKDSGARQTVDAVDRIVRKFTSKNLDYPTYDFMNEWIYEMQTEGCKGGYINDYIKYTKNYQQFLIETGKPHDPRIKDLKLVKEIQPTKSTLSDDEIEAILSLPAPSYTTYRHGKAFNFHYPSKTYDTMTIFYKILAYTGMRPSEVAGLKIEDVDFGRNVFILRETKTEGRVVPISKALLPILQSYLPQCTEYLFPATKSTVSKVIGGTVWTQNFNERVKRLGIKRPNLTVYSLRHSFATRMLSESGVNIFHVQKILGHKRVETTAIYTHLTTKDIQRAIQKDPLYIRSNPSGKLAYIKELLAGLLLDNEQGLKMRLKDTPTLVSFEASVNI